MQPKLKRNTWLTKAHIVRTKILPYFKDQKMCDIRPRDIIRWQNKMLEGKNKQGKKYAPTYLKTLQSELSALFNHAVRFYELKSNPVVKAGPLGKGKAEEMSFWMKDEYLKFAEAMMNKPRSYYSFEMLYWCRIRSGELLALTPANFNFEKQTVTISKLFTAPTAEISSQALKWQRVTEVLRCRHFSVKNCRNTFTCFMI